MRSKNIILLTASSEGSAKREIELIENFERMELIDGLIFITTGQSGAETLLSVLTNKEGGEWALPMIIFDRNLPLGGFDYITVDSTNGTLTAVDHLISYGHTKIAYLAGLEGTETARERLEAFEFAMGKNRIEIDSKYIFKGDFQASSGKWCADSIISLPIEERPTALLCANDMMAIAAMQRFQENGLSIPRDISIVGFDDIKACEWVYPKLTTIGQPTSRLAIDAVKMLIDRADCNNPEEASSPKDIRMKPILIPRQSVGKPRSTQELGLKLVN